MITRGEAGEFFRGCTEPEKAQSHTQDLLHAFIFTASAHTSAPGGTAAIAKATVHGSMHAVALSSPESHNRVHTQAHGQNQELPYSLMRKVLDPSSNEEATTASLRTRAIFKRNALRTQMHKE